MLDKTVTCLVADALQLFTVEVAVYVVVTEGLAVTDAEVDELNPVVGLQVYVEPPDAVKLTELPAQIVALAGEIEIVGPLFIHVAAAYLALILFPGCEPNPLERFTPTPPTK
jgi:hypothetical protein